MSEDVLGRIRGDIAVMQRALGLRLSFGKGMLAFGILLTVAAVGGAVVSLLVENDWLQLAPLAAISVLVPAGLFLQSRRTNLSHEINLQVLVSVCIYWVVWVAASGYSMATRAGPAVGVVRTALLHATSIGILLAFSLMLVSSALKSRERFYGLGLAISTLLAGMLLPIFDSHYSYPLAHCFMAIGYLTGVAIQWVQLREAVANHAAD